MVLLVINGVIGSGIFGLPSKTFKEVGVYSIAAFLVCAIAVFVIILCFAEVSSRFDKTGVISMRLIWAIAGISYRLVVVSNKRYYLCSAYKFTGHLSYRIF
jgi:amino acid transporter